MDALDGQIASSYQQLCLSPYALLTGDLSRHEDACCLASSSGASNPFTTRSNSDDTVMLVVFIAVVDSHRTISCSIKTVISYTYRTLTCILLKLLFCIPVELFRVFCYNCFLSPLVYYFVCSVNSSLLFPSNYSV